MAKLVMGLMYSNEELLKEVKEKLEKKFSKIKDEVYYDFNFTTYYEEEMGKNLKKNIVAFEKVIKKKQLPEIKKYANKMEDRYRIKGNRKINIDPGYLTKKELVLASNKKSSYKTIAENIYAHLILRFENNEYVILPRTFPDFRTEKVQKFLTRIIQPQRLP